MTQLAGAEKYLITVESDQLLHAASEDPFGFRDITGRVPELIDHGDVGRLTNFLSYIGGVAIDTIDAPREMTQSEMLTMLSAVDLIASAATFTRQAQGEEGVDVIAENPIILPAFLKPSTEMKQASSRLLVSGYSAFEPGVHSYTGTKEESSFAQCIREACLATNYALGRLADIDFSNLVVSDVADRLADAAKALSVLWDSQIQVESQVPLVYFDHNIGNKFVPLIFGKKKQYAQGAAHLPLLAVDHILRGIDIPKDSNNYWHHFNISRPYLTAKQEAQLQKFIDTNGLSLLGYIAHGMNTKGTQPLPAESRSILTIGVDECLRQIDMWRAKHLRWVKNSFKSNRPDGATGSTGGDDESLSGIYHETRRPRKYTLVTVPGPDEEIGRFTEF